MEITAAQVSALREKTGVGMMQCKKALAESGGDMEKAVDILRKQGAAVAVKRADKVAKEGGVFLGQAQNRFAAVELNCETDFVAKSPDFLELAKFALDGVLTGKYADVNALKSAPAGGQNLEGRINELLAKIGENISVRRFSTVNVGANELCAQYSHMGGKIGVLVKLGWQGSPSSPQELQLLAKDLAMQVAAAHPLAVNESGVSTEIIAKEREIYKEQVAADPATKPEFADRVVDGKLKKFLKEVSLEDQAFVKDPKQTVKGLLKATADKLGLSSLLVVEFVRLELGK